jgi:MFS family permease
VTGPVSDRHGRAPVLRVALRVSLVATGVLLQSLPALYAGRFLAGLAAGAALTLALTRRGAARPSRDRPVAAP